MARTPISYSDLDFDGLKSSLKTFLQGKTEYQDWNFEGSNINMLLDILAANASTYAVYTNLVANESFLDSALLRSSVVSHAKTLGYTPKSSTAPKAIVGLTLTNIVGDPASIVLPEGSIFKTTVDDVKRDFVTLNDMIIPKISAGVYNLPSIEIFEGKLFRYTFSVTNQQQTFILPNTGVDISKIKVKVQYSSSNVYQETYVQAQTLIDVKSDTRVFYVQETNQQAEITFGDNVIGKAPVIGNIIIVDYLITNETLANGANVFTSEALSLYNDAIYAVTTILPAVGGASPETVESIRANSRKTFSSQNRSVVPEDYMVNLAAEFPYFKSVNVWGGETNDPPYYGKVFISVLQQNKEPVPVTVKEYIKTIIRKKNVISIRPEVVDADIVNIYLDGFVRYKQQNTPNQQRQIASAITNTISDYNQTHLLAFNNRFSYSKLISAVDDSDVGITSSFFDVSVGVNFKPNFNKAETYNISYRNAIRPGTLTSAPFLIPNSGVNTYYLLSDDGSGSIKINQVINNDVPNAIQRIGDFGKIDYETGKITLTGLNVASMVTGALLFEVIATPKANELGPMFNQVLNIKLEALRLNVIPE